MIASCGLARKNKRDSSSFSRLTSSGSPFRAVADPQRFRNRRNPNRRMASRDILQHNRVGANDGVVPDRDVTQHFASDAEVNMVADDRNSLAAGVCTMHDADAAVNRAVIADDHPVSNEDRLRSVNHEPAADDGASFDLCTGDGRGHKPQEATQQAHGTPQQRKLDRGRPMRQPIAEARPKITIAKRGELAAFDSRIGRKVFLEQGGQADRLCRWLLHALTALKLAMPFVQESVTEIVNTEPQTRRNFQQRHGYFQLLAAKARIGLSQAVDGAAKAVGRNE